MEDFYWIYYNGLLRTFPLLYIASTVVSTREIFLSEILIGAVDKTNKNLGHFGEK